MAVGCIVGTRGTWTACGCEEYIASTVGRGGSVVVYGGAFVRKARCYVICKCQCQQCESNTLITIT